MIPATFAHEARWRYATAAPSVLLLAALSALPIANLVAMSAHDIAWVQGVAKWDFRGPQHYEALAADNLFRAGIANTLWFAVVAVTAQMLLGLALALFVGRIGRGRIVYRTIFLLPILVPGIVIGAIWKLMYNFDFGVINQLAGLVGLAARDWLGERGLALASVVVVDVWHWTPFCFLLLLAGLESLPRNIYEAARVDGASAWDEFVRITLPLLMPTIVVTLLFRLIAAFKVFDEVYLLTGGGPGTATEVVSFTIYRRFFTEDRMGHGAAMSVIVLFVISLFIVLALAAGRGRESRR